MMVNYATICDGSPPNYAYQVVVHKGFLFHMVSTVNMFPWILELGPMYFEYNAVVTLAGADTTTDGISDPIYFQHYDRVGHTPVHHITAITICMIEFQFSTPGHNHWPTDVQQSVTHFYARMEELCKTAQSQQLMQGFSLFFDKETVPDLIPDMNSDISVSNQSSIAPTSRRRTWSDISRDTPSPYRHPSEA